MPVSAGSSRAGSTAGRLGVVGLAETFWRKLGNGVLFALKMGAGDVGGLALSDSELSAGSSRVGSTAGRLGVVGLAETSWQKLGDGVLSALEMGAGVVDQLARSDSELSANSSQADSTVVPNKSLCSLSSANPRSTRLYGSTAGRGGSYIRARSGSARLSRDAT
jgi:hypothetical protein